MSDFVRTYWVDNSDPDVTADELNRIEAGIVSAHSKADELLALALAALARAEATITALTAHVLRLDNPHQLTAAQVGVDVVSQRLASHVADFDNPHHVTADQAKVA